MTPVETILPDAPNADGRNPHIISPRNVPVETVGGILKWTLGNWSRADSFLTTAQPDALFQSRQMILQVAAGWFRLVAKLGCALRGKRGNVHSKKDTLKRELQHGHTEAYTPAEKSRPLICPPRRRS
jgi:hypothetical protein